MTGSVEGFLRPTSAPLDLEVDITGRCQLDCIYCSAAPLLGDEIPYDTLNDIIKEAGSIGVFSLLLTGGEPTIHRDFLKVISTAARCIPSIAVNTNGIRLAREDFARKVNDCAPGVLFSISLDSPNFKLNDLVRGAGGSAAAAAIWNCASLGQPLNVSCVLTPENLDHADDLISYFDGKVKRFSFFPQVPRSVNEAEKLGPDYLEKVRLFCSRVEENYPVNHDISVMLPFRKVGVHSVGGLLGAIRGCTCAFTKMYINPEQRVYPCYYSAGETTYLGSIKGRRLADIWQSEKASHLRAKSVGECLCATRGGTLDVPLRYLDGEQQRREDRFHNRQMS